MHVIIIYFVVYRRQPQGHVGKNLGTFRSVKNPFRPIFSVLIYIINALIALNSLTCSFEGLFSIIIYAGDFIFFNGID